MISLNYHRAVSVLKCVNEVLEVRPAPLEVEEEPVEEVWTHFQVGGRHMDRPWTLCRDHASGKGCLAHWYPDGRQPPPCNYPRTLPLAAAPQIAQDAVGDVCRTLRCRPPTSSPGSPTFIESCCGSCEQTHRRRPSRRSRLSEEAPEEEEEEPEGERRRRWRRHGDGGADIL